MPSIRSCFGWGRFYQHCYGAKQVFTRIDHYVWDRLRRWLRKEVSQDAPPRDPSPILVDASRARARYRWVDQRPVAIVGRPEGWAVHDLLKMRMPDYAYPARESPVHNERCTPGSARGHAKPAAARPPRRAWSTQLYVWVAARFYFLLSFIDAYSRYIVHHKLLIELNGNPWQRSCRRRWKTAGAQPRVVHDHGSEFINRDVAAVIKAHNLIDIKRKPRHPESNGIVERFNGTVREESDDAYGDHYLHAEAIIGKLMRTTMKSGSTRHWAT